MSQSQSELLAMQNFVDYPDLLSYDVNVWMDRSAVDRSAVDRSAVDRSAVLTV